MEYFREQRNSLESINEWRKWNSLITWAYGRLYDTTLCLKKFHLLTVCNFVKS